MNSSRTDHAAILLREGGGERGWANLRFVGSALAATGARVGRIVGDPDAFVVDASGLSASRLGALLRERDTAPALAGVRVEPLSAEGRARLEVAPLSNPVVALFGSAGAPYHHLAIFAACGFDVVPIGAEAIRFGALDGVDVFVMPGGGWEFMEGQLGRLGTAGAQRISDFVAAGGCYLSSCAGTHCVLNLPADAAADWHPAYQRMPKLSAESWLKGDRSTHHVKSPGIGVIRVRLPDPTHPIAAGLPDEFECVYYNGPILLPQADGFTSLLECAGYDVDRFTPGEGLFGNQTVEADSTAMAEAGREGYSAGGVESFGRGLIIGFGLHPEFGCEPSMLDWGTSARLLANAADWSVSTREDPRPAKNLASWTGCQSLPETNAVREQAEGDLKEIVALFRSLPGMDPAEIAAALDPSRARSAFGMDASTIWNQSVERGGTIAQEMIGRLHRWSSAYDGLGDAEPAARHRALRLLSLGEVDEELQDMGYKGVPSLLAEVRALLSTLCVTEADGREPYRAVAMSYLSAFGRLTAASLVLEASQSVLEHGHLVKRLHEEMAEPAPA